MAIKDVTIYIKQRPEDFNGVESSGPFRVAENGGKRRKVKVERTGKRFFFFSVFILLKKPLVGKGCNFSSKDFIFMRRFSRKCTLLDWKVMTVR